MTPRSATLQGHAVGAAVSIRCAALLDGAVQELDVLAVMPAAVYLTTRAPRAEVIALLTSDAVVHPASLVLAAPSVSKPFAGLDRATTVSVGAGRLRIARHEVRVGRWYDPVPRLRATPGSALAGPATVLRAAGGCSGGEQQRRRLDDLVRALDVGATADAIVAVDALLGSGPGLTPTGDDQLAGLLATLHLLRGGAVAGPTEAAVRTHVQDRARARTTLLSAALLEHALDGAVAAPVARLLRAITDVGARGDATASTSLDGAVAAVLAIGATSGRDLLDGITVGLELVATARSVVPSTASCIGDGGAS
jgi:hypothetical protein